MINRDAELPDTQLWNCIFPISLPNNVLVFSLPLRFTFRIISLSRGVPQLKTWGHPYLILSPTAFTVRQFCFVIGSLHIAYACIPSLYPSLCPKKPYFWASSSFSSHFLPLFPQPFSFLLFSFLLFLEIYSPTQSTVRRQEVLLYPGPPFLPQYDQN